MFTIFPTRSVSPDHLAVVFEDQILAWREFNKQIHRLANALVNLGVQNGENV